MPVEGGLGHAEALATVIAGQFTWQVYICMQNYIRARDRSPK